MWPHTTQRNAEGQLRRLGVVTLALLVAFAFLPGMLISSLPPAHAQPPGPAWEFVDTVPGAADGYTPRRIWTAERDVLYVLMGIEMILNAANINFVAFNRFNGDGMDGRMFAIFTIILAAAEAAVALAIILNVYHLFDSVKPNDADLLRE